jgi:hypothetical protein
VVEAVARRHPSDLAKFGAELDILNEGKIAPGNRSGLAQRRINSIWHLFSFDNIKSAE